VGAAIAPVGTPLEPAPDKKPILEELGKGVAQFAEDTVKAPFRLGPEIADYIDYAKKNGTTVANMKYGAEFVSRINLPFYKEVQEDFQKDAELLAALAPHPNRLSSEDREALGRGLVNIGSMVIPVGKATSVAAAGIKSPLLRRIAEVEMHSIASMVAWSMGHAIAEDKPLDEAIKTGIVTGAIAPPIFKGVGYVAGKAVQGGALAASKTILPAAKAVDEAAMRMKLYAQTRYVFDRFWDNNGYVGETFLRRVGLDQLADDLVESRARIFMRAGLWNARVGRAFSKLNQGDRELSARTLNEKITDEQLRAYTKTDPEVIRSAAKELHDTQFRVGSLLQTLGVPVKDPADGSLYRFAMRKDFGTPHIYVDTEQYVRPGSIREEALDVLMTKNRMSRERAELFLEKFNARNMGDVDIITTGRGKIRGNVAMIGRRYNLPGYKTDPAEYMPAYLFNAARRIENTMKFGDPLKPHAPIEHRPEAFNRIVEVTRQLGGGTFNLDPHLKSYAVRGFPVGLTGKSVPVSEFTPETLKQITDLAPALQKEFPGLKFTIGTRVRDGVVEMEIGTVLDKREIALNLARSANQKSITSLGYKGRLLKEHATGITEAGANTPEEAASILRSWIATKAGKPYRDAPGLPKVLTAKTLYPKAFEHVEAIEDPARRATAEAIVARQLGFSHGDTFALRERKAISSIMGAQAVMKLGLSQIAQLSQFVTPNAIAGFRGSLKDLLRLGSRSPELHDRMARTGALLQTLIRQAEAQMTGGEGGFAEAALKRTGFTFMDTQARRYGILRGWSMASYQSERLGELIARRNQPLSGLWGKAERRYVDNQIGAIEKKLALLGLDGKKIAERGGVLTEEEFLRAGQTLSTAANFWGDSLSMPAFSQSEWGRVLYQFKSFIVQQSKFMKDYAIKPALRDGDITPLTKLMLAGGVTGELIQDLKSMARAKPRTVEGWERLLSNYAAFGTFGILGDMWESTVTPGRVAGQVIGPAGSDVANLVYGTGQALRGNPTPLAKQAVSTLLPMVPYVGPPATPAVVNTLFPPKEEQ
jgi:hypothetical protein